MQSKEINYRYFSQLNKSHRGNVAISKSNFTFKNLLIFLSVLLVLLYVGRVSLLSLVSGPYKPILQWGGQGVLCIVMALLVAKKSKLWSSAGVIFIVLTLPGVLLSYELYQSFLKWAAWAILFSVAGPVLITSKARFFRSVSWQAIKFSYLLVTFSSLAWYFFDLPNLGRGPFAGIMSHSMQLGPITAITCLFLIQKAIVTRARFYLLLSFLALIPCLLASSRSALLGLVAGILVLIYYSARCAGVKKSLPMIVIVVCSAIFGSFFMENVKDSNLLYRYTATLEEKGLINSREDLWASRIAEFERSPLFGIGIGMGDVMNGSRRWTGVMVDASGDINVEPGSSYLAVLSMTGISGAFGLFLVVRRIIRKLKVSNRGLMLDSDLFEVLAIVSFFIIHLAAEGYIFAVGSQLCLLFWLCLGRINDIAFLNSAAKPLNK